LSREPASGASSLNARRNAFGNDGQLTWKQAFIRSSKIGPIQKQLKQHSSVPEIIATRLVAMLRRSAAAT
jgi:hypothetical protein